MNLEIDSLNDEQIWNIFKDNKDAYPQAFKVVFEEGIKIPFLISNFFNPHGDAMYFEKHGLVVVFRDLNGVKQRYLTKDFEIELMERISIMKEILRDIYKKKPIATARFNEKLKEATTTL